MKKLLILTCVAAVAIMAPHGAFAKGKHHKKMDPTTIMGKVSAVDQTAKTFTVEARKHSSQVYKVTDSTTFTKGKKDTAATISDLKAGVFVTGTAVEKDSAYVAQTVKISKKHKKHHKKDKAE